MIILKPWPAHNLNPLLTSAGSVAKLPWVQQEHILLQCCFRSTETVRTMSNGEPRMSINFVSLISLAVNPKAESVGTTERALQVAS